MSKCEKYFLGDSLMTVGIGVMTWKFWENWSSIFSEKRMGQEIDPTSAAQSLLDKVWVDKGFPVDPADIASSLGVVVYEANAPGSISGALIKEEGKDPIIVLSKTDSRNRKRFTCAHELGHYAKRSEENAATYKYVDLRSDLSSGGSDPDEIFANRFAAALLMPESAVREFVGRKMPVFLLAETFGVSAEAMSYRLKNLGLT